MLPNKKTESDYSHLKFNKMNYIKSTLIVLLTFSLTISYAQKSQNTLTVKKDHYYQLIKMSLMPNEESKAQLDAYFQKIGSEMMASGAKVYSFAVQNTKVGDGPAQMFLIAEYADNTKPDLIFKSEAFFQNRNLRDKALSYLNEGFFLATSDGEFDISKGELRLISLWVKEGKEEQLNNYFASVTTDAVEKGAIVAPFVFVPDPAIKGKNYNASMVILASWGTKQNETNFYSGKVFKTNVAERDDALKFHEEYDIVYIPENNN